MSPPPNVPIHKTPESSSKIKLIELLLRLLRLSESDVTGDIGIILRPLPVVSFRYIDEKVRKTDKLDYDSDIIGEKGRRVGATLYLRDKLVVSILFGVLGFALNFNNLYLELIPRLPTPVGG